MAVIEVFADVWCPFTHFGLKRFVRHRDRRGADATLRVRAWPLELVNGEPLDPGFVAEEIAEIRSSAAPELFEGFDAGSFPRTTIPALALTAAAYAVSPAAGEGVALELRHRLFEQGQDVSDPGVLASVAAAHGLEVPGAEGRAVVEQEWAAGRERGVIGSPHFFTPGGDFFCPALDVRRVEGHLRVSADPEGFDRFVVSCFGTS